MAFGAWIIAIAVFLSVITAIVFAVLVIGIRKGDRASHLSDGPQTVLEAFTRSFLGVGVRRSEHEENLPVLSNPFRQEKSVMPVTRKRGNGAVQPTRQEVGT